MPKPTVLPPVPPPAFNKWVIIATIVSFLAMIVLSFMEPEPDAIAPDGPLGVPKEAAATGEAEPTAAPEAATPPADSISTPPADSMSAPPADSMSAPPADPVITGDSLAGRYLAGRHAQAIREMGDAARFLESALEISPGTVDLQRRAFMLALAEGHMENAAPLATGVLKANPKAPIAGLVVIIEDIAKSRFEAARDKIEKLPEGGLNVYMAPLLDAWTTFGLTRTADAAIARLKPLAKNGTDALYQLHSAIINDVSGNTDQAELDYLATIDKQGGPSLRVVQLLGNLYERSGLPNKAKTLYEERLKTNPRSPLARTGLKRLASAAVPGLIVGNATDGAAESIFGIATSLSQQNAKETALVFGRMALYLRPDFPVMQMLLGNILQADRRFEAANKIFAAIRRDSPYSWPARLNMAENLDDLERTEEAEKNLRAMAAEEPELASPLTRLGDILRGRERYKEAVDVYNQAMARIGEPQPQHWSLLYARGIVLERSGQWDKAEPDFLKALEFNPNQPMVLNYLGYTWIDKGINLKRATEMIKKAVELRPMDGYIADSLGWAHYRLGNYQESAKEMERAVALRPEDPVINDHLGDVYWRVGRTNEARFQWRRVLTLDPEDKLAGQVRDKLKNGLKPVAETD